MNLRNALEGKEYIIKDILTDDEELNSFLTMKEEDEYFYNETDITDINKEQIETLK